MRNCLFSQLSWCCKEGSNFKSNLSTLKCGSNVSREKLAKSERWAMLPLKADTALQRSRHQNRYSPKLGTRGGLEESFKRNLLT